MEQMFSIMRFIIIHMLQEEGVLMFVITILLFWVLNMRLAKYSTKTREAALARRFAMVFAGLATTIAVLGKVFR